MYEIINQERRRQDPDDDNNPSNTLTSRNNMDPNDLITHLPDNLLHHIISLLPFESAVRTSCLSTHWKHIWKEALLDSVLLDVITMEDAIKAILSFLDGFDAQHRPSNKWGLIFEFSPILVASIISRKAALKLNFSDAKQKSPKPFDLLLNLNLASSHDFSDPGRFGWFIEEDHPLRNLQLTLNTRNVKALYLISVTHLSNMAASCLVPNLPFLETLTIAKCNGLRSLQIKVAHYTYHYHYEGLQLIVLDCPHLQSIRFEDSLYQVKSFRYRGNSVSFKFQMLPDGPNPYFGFYWLEDLMLDIRQGRPTQWTWEPFCKTNHCGDTNRHKCFNSILAGIYIVKSLTICRSFYEASMSRREYAYWLRKLKELWWIDCSMGRESFKALLCFLRHCPNLERLYVTIDPECYDLPSTGKCSTLVKAPLKLDYLKVVKLEGFADEQREMVMARRLMRLFGEKNDPVIISKSSDGKCLKHLVKVAKLVKKGKYPYKFKVVENVDVNFPDHVHMNL